MPEKKKAKKKTVKKAKAPGTGKKAKKSPPKPVKKRAAKASSNSGAKPALKKKPKTAIVPNQVKPEAIPSGGKQATLQEMVGEGSSNPSAPGPVERSAGQMGHDVAQGLLENRKLFLDDIGEGELPAPKDDYLYFRFGNERYALEASNVNEILRHQRITHVPKCAPHVIGATSLRGAMIPVLNLGALLTGKESSPPKDGRILVLKDAGIQIGVLVERKIGIIGLGAEDLLPPPTGGEGGGFASGTLDIKGEYYAVLRPEAITRTRAIGRLDEREA